MNKLQCPECQRDITKNNFKRHVSTCDGTYFTGPHKPSGKTKEEIKNSQLEHLEKIRKIARTKPIWNKGLTKDDPRVAKYVDITKKQYSSGQRKAAGCFAWSSEKKSVVAKERGLGGYRENAGISKKFRVTDSFGNEVVLQSTYELKCSEIMNELQIKWIRPKSLKYDGKNYFADFYLPNYNIYLDPKNSYKAKLDIEKIDKVRKQNNVIIHVLLEEHLNKEWFYSLMGKPTTDNR